METRCPLPSLNLPPFPSFFPFPSLLFPVSPLSVDPLLSSPILLPFFPAT